MISHFASIFASNQQYDSENDITQTKKKYTGNLSVCLKKKISTKKNVCDIKSCFQHTITIRAFSVCIDFERVTRLK